jgi:molybdopterin molybdotransferase
MLSPAEAEKVIMDAVRPWAAEEVPLSNARGRVLRAEIRADRDLPPYDRVTMDGYAARSAALAAGSRRFRVEAVQPAGVPRGRLGAAAEACIEVMTGAVLPDGADCVVPYEDTRREGEWVEVTSAEPPAAGQAVHPKGSDNRAGEVIVPAGTRLTGREIAVAAACGYANVRVTCRPRIAILATGDELVELGEPVAEHQVRRSNDRALAAALAGADYPGAERFHTKDDRAEVEHLLWHLLAEYDALVVAGGISKGKFDFLPEELERQGVRRHLRGVAQRPGKPFWFGATARGTPVFGLPGNPVSSYVCLHRYAVPALDHASGATARPRPQAALAASHRTGGKLAALVPVKLSVSAAAELRADPSPCNTSGDFAELVGTDGFVELPAGRDEYPAGCCARFFRWL